MLLDCIEFVDISLGHAGDNIKDKIFFRRHHRNSIRGCTEAIRIATHIVVVILQSIKRNGRRVQSRCKQSIKPLTGHGKAVCHHPPRKTAIVDSSTALFKIFTHQRLATRNNHKDLVWIGMRSNVVKHAEEVLKWHILLLCNTLAVASTVTAVEIATQRALPK